MKTSPAGRMLIAQREGRKLAAYRDSEGILTIGVGHTGRMSPPPVVAGMTISEARCDDLLASDLAPVEAALNTFVNVPLTQNEFDAMASLGFNIGVGGLKGSTVLRRLNRGDVAGAADAFLLWDRPKGLAGRRKQERAQFLAPDRHDAPHRPGVAAARAATLTTQAEAAKGKAHAAQSGAAALIVASVTTVATSPARHHVLAFVVGGLVLAAGMGAALVAALSYRAARVLTANAGRQMPKESASSPLINSLES